MVNAVVVHRDPAVVADRAAVLRAAGYNVETCGGPGQDLCPVLGDMPCPLVDRADVLVYDAKIAGGGAAARQIVAEVRDTYPDLPIVLTSVDDAVDWVETDGAHRVTPLGVEPTSTELREAIERALADQGMAA